jgi:hypothetical protein
MARTTIDEVLAILPPSTSLEPLQINAAIMAATCVVDQIASGCASHLSEDCLKQIETYLAAHFAAATENTLTLSAEKDGCTESSATYGFKFGEGVKGTPFGIMANTLSGGCLAEADKTPARMFSIGCS